MGMPKLGSFVEVMRSLLGHSNPLYGRVDLTIDLKQMDYYESSLFYPNYSSEDKVRIYSVFGGIPYYNRLIDDSKSVKENIIDLIASSGARLENEVSMYLKVNSVEEVTGNVQQEGVEMESSISDSAEEMSTEVKALNTYYAVFFTGTAIETQITFIEEARNMVEETLPGVTYGIGVSNLEKEDIEAGDILIATDIDEESNE